MLCHETQTLDQEKQPQPLLETPKIVKRLMNGDKFYWRTGTGSRCSLCSLSSKHFARREALKAFHGAHRDTQRKARRGASYGWHFIQSGEKRFLASWNYCFGVPGGALAIQDFIRTATRSDEDAYWNGRAAERSATESGTLGACPGCDAQERAGRCFD